MVPILLTRISVYGAKYYLFHLGLVAKTYSLSQVAPTKAAQFKVSEALSVHLSVDMFVVVLVKYHFQDPDFGSLNHIFLF